MIDIRCLGCGHDFCDFVGNTISTTWDGRCPACGSDSCRRQFSAPYKHCQRDSRSMDEHEVRAHLAHKADIEHAAASGRLLDLKGRSKFGSEFEPRLPKRWY